MDVLYVIKWLIKVVGVFVILPFFVLYLIGALSTDGFNWGGWPYVIIIVSVSIIFGIIECFKQPKNRKINIKLR